MLGQSNTKGGRKRNNQYATKQIPFTILSVDNGMAASCLKGQQMVLLNNV